MADILTLFASFVVVNFQCALLLFNYVDLPRLLLLLLRPSFPLGGSHFLCTLLYGGPAEPFVLWAGPFVRAALMLRLLSHYV